MQILCQDRLQGYIQENGCSSDPCLSWTVQTSSSLRKDGAVLRQRAPHPYISWIHLRRLLSLTLGSCRTPFFRSVRNVLYLRFPFSFDKIPHEECNAHS